MSVIAMVVVMAIVLALAVGVLLGGIMMGFGDQQLDLLRARLMAEQRIAQVTRSALQAMRQAGMRR